MPTIPDIIASIENQQSFVLDPHAKKGTFKRSPSRGRLIHLQEDLVLFSHIQSIMKGGV